jgi:hypothetical protein
LNRRSQTFLAEADGSAFPKCEPGARKSTCGPRLNNVKTELPAGSPSHFEAPADHRVAASALATCHTAKSRLRVKGGRRTMSAATAAFLGSGRRVPATVAPPATLNRACN